MILELATIWGVSSLLLSGILGENIASDVSAIKNLPSTKKKLKEGSAIFVGTIIILLCGPPIVLFYIGRGLRQFNDNVTENISVLNATHNACVRLSETSNDLREYIRQKHIRVSAQPGAIVIIGDEKKVQQ